MLPTIHDNIKKTCLKGIGLHAQNMSTILGSVGNIIGDLLDCFMAPTFLNLEAKWEIRKFHRLLQKPHITSMDPRKS